MIIHNKLKITKGEDTYFSYNNLLLPALEAISELKAYNEYLAIGTGGSETDRAMETLEKYAVTLPLVTEKMNYDPLNGTLFVTKKLVLDENNKQALEIVEVGLTAESESLNPRVANRFLANAGAPIYRDPGEEMAIEVTMYLDFLTDESPLKLMGGSNPLVKLLLGGGVSSAESCFKIGKGVNETANAEIFTRTTDDLEVMDASLEAVVDAESATLTMKVIGNLGAGVVKEFLVLLDGAVVARENVYECASGEETALITLTGDYDNRVTLPDTGVKEVSGVVTNADQTAVEGFSVSSYANSFDGEFFEIFSGMGYTPKTKRVVSKRDNLVCFILDDHLDIYDFSSGEVVKYDTSLVDITNAYLFMVFDKYLLLKKYDPEMGTYEVDSYTRKKPTYDSYKPTEFWADGHSDIPDSMPDGNWTSWDTATDLEDEKYCNLVFTTPDWIYYLRIYADVVGNYFTTMRHYCNIYYHDYVRCQNPSNRLGFSFMTYDTRDDEVGVRKGYYYYEFSDPTALEIAKNYKEQGYPYYAKNFIYAWDGDLKKFRAYSLDSESSKVISFPNATKVWHNTNLDYVAVKEADGIKLYFVDGSLKTYEFSSPLPVPEGCDVVDLMFMFPFVVVFLDDGRILAIKLNYNKFYISGIEKGTRVDVGYLVDTTPGISGGDVKATAQIIATV